MLLKDYIKQTLLDITQAVGEARREACLCIAPGRFNDKEQNDPSMVAFEIAVTVSKDGGGKIEIFSVVATGGNYSTESFNKVSFSVPVYFNSGPMHSNAPTKAQSE